MGEYGREVFVPDTNGRVYPVGSGGVGMGGGFTLNQKFVTDPGIQMRTQEIASGQSNRRQQVVIDEMVAGGLRSSQGQAALEQRRIAQR